MRVFLDNHSVGDTRKCRYSFQLESMYFTMKQFSCHKKMFVLPVYFEFSPKNDREFKEIIFFVTNYRQDPNKSGGGTQSFSTPPTAYMAEANFSLAVADYTLGGYNWRHCSDF